MILPIVAFGDAVLKAEATELVQPHAGLKELVENMWETMYDADGVGLAGPQIGQSIRIFVCDGSPFAEGERGDASCTEGEVSEAFQMAVLKKLPIIYVVQDNEWDI